MIFGKKDANNNSQVDDLPIELKKLGSAIREASANLTLLRTSKLKQSSGKVAKVIDKIQQTDEIENHARPFLELLDTVKRDLTRFDSTDHETLRELITWLVRKNRPDAALTLASEWLISWVMLKLGEKSHHTGHDIRKPYAETLNLLINRSKSNQPGDRGHSSESQGYLDRLTEILAETGPSPEHLAAIASRIREARNDLNHAGFNQHPGKPAR